VEAKRIEDSRWKEGNGVEAKAKCEEEKTWRTAERKPAGKSTFRHVFGAERRHILCYTYL